MIPMENATPGLVTDLAHLRNRHKGERILVLGLGPSMRELTDPACLTIGVNDIGRWLTPDYLLVMDPPWSFDRDGPERMDAICACRPRKAFVLCQGYEHEWIKDDRFSTPYVHAKLAPVQPQNHVPPFHDHGFQIHKTGAGSPATAASLALFMGAGSVGLLGVDLVDHPRIKGAEMIADMDVNGWARLAVLARDCGSEIVNLSPISVLKSLPKMGYSEWLHR